MTRDTDPLTLLTDAAVNAFDTSANGTPVEQGKPARVFSEEEEGDYAWQRPARRRFSDLDDKPRLCHGMG